VSWSLGGKNFLATRTRRRQGSPGNTRKRIRKDAKKYVIVRFSNNYQNIIMNKNIVIIGIYLFALPLGTCKSRTETVLSNYKVVPTDSLPVVFPENKSDLIDKQLRYEAALRFAEHQLPGTMKEWEEYRVKLRNEVITRAGVVANHQLPLNIKETGSVKMKTYIIKNITFQTRPGVYATANLFIPDGTGPFPAVINMLGHWRKGKIDDTGPQAVGHTLATNGYVCLTIDPWGAGERGTKHGIYEYHGSNLGASLMNIGEPLIGLQISDNMRGIDLLCSLPVVDTMKIGATGASGGGNQTMWLSAVDERVKADVPVVSVGTFESYIMESNCICEQLPDGLTFTEEAGIVALSNAPLLINHKQDSNPTFFPAEMLRSYNNARKVFSISQKESSISCQLFDLPHGYEREDREAMLGWFDLHLKGTGNGAPRKELPFEQLPEEKLLVFPAGERDANVVSTDEYCRNKGKELRNSFLNTKSFNTHQKEKELKEILRIDKKLSLNQVYKFSSADGWDRLALETADQRLIPLLLLAPAAASSGYVIICNPDGKKSISLSLIDELKKKGTGIVIADLSGTGELTSTRSVAYDYTGKLHTLSRAELWLGRTVLGEWIKEMDLVNQFLYTKCHAQKISIDGTRESGLAGLFYAAMGGKVGSVTLRDAPVSYVFDSRESVDYFSMGIHLPGFLKWGDVSLAAALSGKNITFINPVTMSGNSLDNTSLKNFQDEFDKIRNICGLKGETSLVKF
jgi:hypothetical protein